MSDTPDPDLVKRVEQAARSMPRLQREIFMARRLDDMSYAEIARRTGLTICRVEHQMSRAIYKLDKLLHGGKLSWWERWF